MDLQIRIALNLVFAFFVGVLVGLNREISNRPAGVRTQILICVGSTLITSVSIHMAAWLGMSSDPARLTAQIVSGVGFLGGGVILKSSERVIGVTTAAMIWFSAALGIAIGSEFYLPAAVATAMLLLTEPIAYLEYWAGLKNKPYALFVKKEQYNPTSRIMEEYDLEEDSHQIEDGRVQIAFFSTKQKNDKLGKKLTEKQIDHEFRRRERFIT